MSRRLAAIAATAGVIAAGAPVAGASAHAGRGAGAAPSGSVPVPPMLPGGPLALAPLVAHQGG